MTATALGLAALGSAIPAVGAATTRADGSVAAAVRPRLKLTTIARVDGPVTMAVRTGDPAIYVAEQHTGKVRVVRGNKVLATPALDLGDRVSLGNEQGLLGLVFSPDGSKLYAYFTNGHGDSRLFEYPFANGVADKAHGRQLLAIPQPQANHNGGQLAFGPDGNLYLGLGDGGNANDEGTGHVAGGNAQSPHSLLGKILRITPTASARAGYTIPATNPYAEGGGAPEVFADGLRNPWRFSFDTETHDLWIGDVGQNEVEEIDHVPFATAAGSDFGWHLFEGTHRFRSGTAPAGLVPPVYEYLHADGGCAVIGGYVYRGSRIAALRGTYLFTDNCKGAVMGLAQSGKAGKAVKVRDLGISVASPTSFGQDAQGNLYVLSGEGTVQRIDPR
ncbi:MAG: glucose/sorbosone dehydrogenase-like protein [Actinomycetia bacterium]|nr:glucose/sorbosone dehydrogenase-like protein [Actinomycetes bacterium]